MLLKNKNDFMIAFKFVEILKANLNCIQLLFYILNDINNDEEVDRELLNAYRS